jgi:hypothetical protein
VYVKFRHDNWHRKKYFMLFLYQYILPTHNSSMTKVNNITHYDNNYYCVQQSSVLQVFNLIDLYMMIALYL